jgi:lipopolysaccharide biosynthesis regulator YciM
MTITESTKETAVLVAVSILLLIIGFMFGEVAGRNEASKECVDQIKRVSGSWQSAVLSVTDKCVDRMRELDRLREK